MRIIAGKYRSRELKASEHFRPTTDRVRETLFNIIQTEIPESVLVDGFSGSGSVGIEALSRGASMVYFIENNRRNAGILEKNLEVCCEEDNWRIYTLPIFKGLEVIAESSQKPSLIFFDPPYDYSDYEELLLRTVSLFPEATVILESSVRTSLPEIREVELFKERSIGETRISFHRKK